MLFRSHADETVEHFVKHFQPGNPSRGQHLYPVVDAQRHVVSVMTRKEVNEIVRRPLEAGATMATLGRQAPTVAYASEPLRVVANRMAERQITRMPVLDPEEHKLVGMVSLEDLLSGRARVLNEERTRERVLRIRFPRD